jgi:hypothetical protein
MIIRIVLFSNSFSQYKIGVFPNISYGENFYYHRHQTNISQSKSPARIFFVNSECICEKDELTFPRKRKEKEGTEFPARNQNQTIENTLTF